jgi:hypothetical protein
MNCTRCDELVRDKIQNVDRNLFQRRRKHFEGPGFLSWAASYLREHNKGRVCSVFAFPWESWEKSFEMLSSRPGFGGFMQSRTATYMAGKFLQDP